MENPLCCVGFTSERCACIRNRYMRIGVDGLVMKISDGKNRYMIICSSVRFNINTNQIAGPAFISTSVELPSSCQYVKGALLCRSVFDIRILEYYSACTVFSYRINNHHLSACMSFSCSVHRLSSLLWWLPSQQW